MDWSRAKTVLICAFLLLNVLLGYQLWIDELNISSFTENAERREEMNRQMAVKHARVDTAVPEATPVLSEITVNLQTRQDDPQPRVLTKPFSKTLLSDPAQLRAALKADIPKIGEYEPDLHAEVQDDAVFVMNQLYEGLPMFEMRVELYGEAEQIDSYRYIYSEAAPAENAESVTGAGQEILSAYIVLGNLAENYLPQGAVVTNVQLGYHGPIFESMTQVLAPYWRVVLDSGEIYYVHAVTGAVEGPSSV